MEELLHTDVGKFDSVPPLSIESMFALRWGVAKW
jgi:hypothetical protein